MNKLVAVSKEQSNEINKAESILNSAKNLIINNDLSYTTAGEMLKKIKAKKNSLDDMRKDLKKPINEAAKKIEDMFRQPLNYLLQAEQKIKNSMLEYKETMDFKTENQQQDLNEALQNIDLEIMTALKEGHEGEYHRLC